MNPRLLAERYCVRQPTRFRLSSLDPAATTGFKSKQAAKELFDEQLELLQELQQRLYAENRWALLLIFQGMDASGKDSAIRHVTSSVNPQGCQVHSFKKPSSNELDHDFMWRTHARAPERGQIGIFNRSYYEEVLIVRVHPKILAGQKLPARLLSKNIWQERYEDINAYERYLTRNGIVVLKFFLHLSPEEQKRRFLKRIDTPEKHWKFEPADVEERSHWKDYMHAYEEMVRQTSNKVAPWYAIPADNKWYTRLVVAAAVVQALQSLNLEYPKVDKARLEQLNASRQALLSEE